MNKNNNFDPDLVKQFLNEYQDRGMLKWQGFYLSDQTAKLREAENQQYETEHRERSREMSSAAINHVIQKALLKKLTKFIFSSFLKPLVIEAFLLLLISDK